MRVLFFLAAILFSNFCKAQDVSAKLSDAMERMMADSQLRHGIVSLYVIDSKTGAVVYEKNKELGLAGASVQKVITSSTAYELLGHDYTYRTTLSYDGVLKNNVLDGNIIIHGSGDPTLGSWRYETTKEDRVINEFKNAILTQGIKKISGKIIGDKKSWSSEMIPDGWIWEDLGSYYGAGASALNWRENQYDLIMSSGARMGDTVKFAGTNPSTIEGLKIKMEAIAGQKGSGDRSYIFIPSTDDQYYVRGSIPINENHFVIAGAMLHPEVQLGTTLLKSLPEGFSLNREKPYLSPSNNHLFYTHTSPPLDSIAFWFLKKSINLYGEALLKTIAYEKTRFGSTDTGINIIKAFWKDRGIDPQSLNMKDGSGLSPGNRLTTNALVNILQYDLQQPWFESFLNALPEINGLKMKSGTIGDVLAYTGFSKSSDGKKYTFAMIINNYNGSTSLMRQKMWKMLDILK